jgi:hypothetical protein
MNKKLGTVIFILFLVFSQSVKAQAYDGDAETRIFLGYTNIEGKSGGEFQLDNGLNDYVSYGIKLIFISGTKKDNDEFSALDGFDASFFLRFHFLEVLKSNEKIDPYLGVDASLKSIGLHGGIKYNFGDIIGVYAQVGKGFSNSLSNGISKKDIPEPDRTYDDKGNVVHESIGDYRVNYFGKSFSFNVGITINAF